MSEVMVLMSAILAGELLLVLLVLLSYAWFRNRALQRRDAKAVRVLATRIKNTRNEREARIARFLSEQMGISGEAQEQAKTAMLRAELLLLQRFAGVYRKRDAGAAAQFDIDLAAALAPYYELDGGGVVVTHEQPNEDASELDSLRAENQRLSDELGVTMETMSRMLNEYSTMFTGGSLGQSGPIAALVGGGDGARPEGETVVEPVAGQTVLSSDPDTPVEMAAQAECAVDLETDLDPNIQVEEGGGDSDNVDTGAQDDIDELFAAQSDVPPPEELGDEGEISDMTADLVEPTGTDGSLDQAVDAEAVSKFEAEPGVETEVDEAAPEAGGNLEAVAAPAGEHTTDDLLGRPLGVDVGGVEERDPALLAFVDDSSRRLEVEPSAEVVGAQAHCGHLQAGAPERAGLHRSAAFRPREARPIRSASSMSAGKWQAAS